MNLILLEPQELAADGSVRLTDARHKHILTVLKAESGKALKVGFVDGKRGTANIVESQTSHTLLDNIQCNDEPPAKLPLTVVLALPRPKAARRICRCLAELGVEQLILLNSYRVEKSYWQSPLLTEDRIRSYFLEGLQQAGDTLLPTLQIEKRLKPFVEDRLPSLTVGKRALVAHPRTDSDRPAMRMEPTVLAIGPEGGFIPYEVEKLQQAGMETINLGERILKVETAVPTLIAKLFP